MIYTWLFTRLLDWRTYAYAALVGILLTLTYKVEQYGYKRGVAQSSSTISALNKQINDGRDLYAKSLQDSLRKQTEWQAQADQATQDANNAQIKLEILRGDNQRLNDSLRVTTAKASERAKLPETSNDDRNEYIAILGAGFEGCATAYLDLASKARAISINAKQVIDSYPQSK